MTENITKHKQMTKQFEIKEWRKDQKLNGTWTNLGLRRREKETVCWSEFVGAETLCWSKFVHRQPYFVGKREITETTIANRRNRRQPLFRSPRLCVETRRQIFVFLVCVCVLRRGGSRVLTCVCVLFFFFFWQIQCVFVKWWKNEREMKWVSQRREGTNFLFFFNYK
jgi:hypothetical protein